MKWIHWHLKHGAQGLLVVRSRTTLYSGSTSCGRSCSSDWYLDLKTIVRGSSKAESYCCYNWRVRHIHMPQTLVSYVIIGEQKKTTVAYGQSSDNDTFRTQLTRKASRPRASVTTGFRQSHERRMVKAIERRFFSSSNQPFSNE